mmetsp:Transcript_20085/g.28279  ORF Transcript_20085/g.28279 Transcript_20085/m.28279 type:complete len:324 (+) Transcript_20085:62-1033(+)
MDGNKEIRHPSDWTEEDMASFVRGLGRGAVWQGYAELCVREGIDGSTLLNAELSDLTEYGIRPIHARTILKNVKQTAGIEDNLADAKAAAASTLLPLPLELHKQISTGCKLATVQTTRPKIEDRFTLKSSMCTMCSRYYGHLEGKCSLCAAGVEFVHIEHKIVIKVLNESLHELEKKGIVQVATKENICVLKKMLKLGVGITDLIEYVIENNVNLRLEQTKDLLNSKWKHYDSLNLAHFMFHITLDVWERYDGPHADALGCYHSRLPSHPSWWLMKTKIGQEVSQEAMERRIRNTFWYKTHLRHLVSKRSMKSRDFTCVRKDT